MMLRYGKSRRVLTAKSAITVEPPIPDPRKVADLRTTAVFQERIETTPEVVHYEPLRSGPSEFRTTDTDDIPRPSQPYIFVLHSGQQKPAHKKIHAYNYRLAQTTKWLPAILDYMKNVMSSISTCLAQFPNSDS